MWLESLFALGQQQHDLSERLSTVAQGQTNPRAPIFGRSVAGDRLSPVDLDNKPFDPAKTRYQLTRPYWISTHWVQARQPIDHVQELKRQHWFPRSAPRNPAPGTDSADELLVSR